MYVGRRQRNMNHTNKETQQRDIIHGTKHHGIKNLLVRDRKIIKKKHAASLNRKHEYMYPHSRHACNT
jgi:hypothetical protein